MGLTVWRDRSRQRESALTDSVLVERSAHDPPPFVVRRLRSRSRLLLTLAVLAAVTVVVTPVIALSARASVPPTPAGWTLVFSDDFNGAANTGVNTGNWLYDLGTGYPGGAPNWGTGEIETMTNSTANVYPGRRRPPGHHARSATRPGNWTSGRIETQRTDFAAAGRRQAADRGVASSSPTSRRGGGRLLARVLDAGRRRPPGRRDQLARASARSTSWRTSTGAAPCSPRSTVDRHPGGDLQRDHRPGQRRAGLPRLPDRLPHLRRGVGPQRVAGADPVVPRRRPVLLASTPTRSTATTWNNATHHGFFIILNVAMGGGFPAAFGGGPTAADPARRADAGRLRRRVHQRRRHATDHDPADHDRRRRTRATGTPTRTIQAECFNAQSGAQPRPPPTPAAGRTWAGSPTATGPQYNGRQLRQQRRPPVQRPGRLRAPAAGSAAWSRSGWTTSTTPPIGSFAIANTGGWQTWRTVPANICGRHRHAHGLPAVHQRPAGRLRERQLVHLRTLIGIAA